MQHTTPHPFILRGGRLIPALAVALAATLAVAQPAHAGPPWVSVEYPANPHDALTRGALAVVHAYHHGEARDVRVTAMAVGLVDGARRTLELQAVPTSRPGVYAIRGHLPPEGAWVLKVHTRDGERGAEATALLALGAERELLAVRVPYEIAEGRWHVPRPPTEAEVDALLRSAVAMGAVAGAEVAAGASGAASASAETSTGTSTGTAALLLMLPAGAVVAWRRRRGSAA